ncbi:hypothetical protein FD755_016965 [Muntiacus reevesi]|uniref:Abasic site processing protein HMCES n=1 Tax=Muntiacus reevesi TaxID=9886 RepID=A0A5N3XA16_MUNRE|nr:hypothetical protein FD755_016965 [Muntiacus reevesi]
MCGWTSCHLPKEVLARACAYRDRQGHQRLPEWRDPDRYCPSYNKSPRSNSPDTDSSEQIIAPMRWGLVPYWFKEADLSNDTIMEKRSFKVPLVKGRRCVVLADGFYEWYPEDWEKVWDNWRPLIAGIFDCWEPPEGGDCLYSYSIITVDSCKVMTDIHNRMPAILDGEETVSKWLDFGEVSAQEALKLIHPTENIAFHPVSSMVNRSWNNAPECLLPLHLLTRKELKASASSQKMLQWLATKSPKKEEPKTPQKAESDVPQWSSHASLLERWLKRGQEEEPAAKRPHTQ